MATTPKGGTPTLAFHYLRFSSPGQLDGDSVRRQTLAAASWCKRNGVTLDTTTPLSDLGVSAFRGKHLSDPTKFALARFVEMVEQGHIPAGSHFVIESMDRLSRGGDMESLELVIKILKAGVRIVTLSPEQVIEAGGGLLALIPAMVSLERGHDESRVKSDRGKSAWDLARKNAREKGELVNRRVPAWISVDKDGKRHLIPDRAATVKRIFELVAGGTGLYTLAAKLRTDGTPPFGKKVVKTGKTRSQFSGRWSISTIHKILKSRATLGEYQPHIGKEPDGPPVVGYFPACVSEELFLRAGSALSSRLFKPGRIGNADLNVFAGLVQDARSGDSMTMYRHRDRRHGRDHVYACLRCTASRTTGARELAVDATVFEREVLRFLNEIDPATIFGENASGDKIDALRAEVAVLTKSVQELLDDLDTNGHSPATRELLRRQETKLRDTSAALTVEKQKAANPKAVAFGEMKSLVGALAHAGNTPEARLKLRQAIRNVVEKILVLIVTKGIDRAVAVQVFFKTDGDEFQRSRTYRIHYRRARVNGSGRSPLRVATVQVVSDARQLIHDQLYVSGGSGRYITLHDLRTKGGTAATEKEMESLTREDFDQRYDHAERLCTTLAKGEKQGRR